MPPSTFPRASLQIRDSQTPSLRLCTSKLRLRFDSIFDLCSPLETPWKFQSTRSCSRILSFSGFLITNRSRSTMPRESNFVLSVPPDILSTGTSEGEVSVLEGENATLSCKASGRPTPRVLWRREKSGFILMRGLHDPLIPGKILHFYLDSSTLATVVPDDK